MSLKKDPGTNAAGPFVQLLKPTVLALAMGCVGSAWAVEGGNVVAGTGSIDTRGNKTIISQSSDKMIVNWNNFDIARNQSVDIRQPGASSAVLNRASGSPTQILGTLKANGRVFVVNPAGVVFGRSAKVDVGSLVASTLDVDDAQFMRNGNEQARGGSRVAPPANQNVMLSASANGRQGEVRNEGRIDARGQVLLLGAQAVNNGLIRAADVGLAATDQALLVLGDSGYSVWMQEPAVNALAQNGGLIIAKGGDVRMSAMATGDMLRSVIRNTGTIEANKATAGTGGNIVLSSELDGVISAGGKLVADQSIAMSTGPSVHAQDGPYGLTPPTAYAPSGHDITIERGARLRARQGDVIIGALAGDVTSRGRIQADRISISGDSVTIDAPINVARDAEVVAEQGLLAQNADIRAGGNVSLSGRDISQGDGVLTSAGGQVKLRTTQEPSTSGPGDMELQVLKGVARVADIKADSIKIDGEHVYLNGNLKADGDIEVVGSHDYAVCIPEVQCFDPSPGGAITQNGLVVSRNGNVMMAADQMIRQTASSRTHAGESVELKAHSVEAGNIRANDRIAIDATYAKLIGSLTAREVILPPGTENEEGNVRIKPRR